MFLIEKYHGHGHDRHSKKLHNDSPKKPFEETLIFRLKSLPPLPQSSSSPPSIPLSWLVSAVRLLTSTLSSFASLLSDPSLSGSDPRALSSHLDSSSASLLDAANALSADIDRLTSLRLHLRLHLRRLSSSGSVPVWDPKPAPSSSAPTTLLSIPPPPPRGKISAVRRAIYAVEAVSALVVGSVLAGLGHDASSLARIRVPAEYPWADAFNSVASAVRGWTGAEEIAAVGTSAERLKAALVGKDGAQVEEAVAATEKRTEEMAEGLEELGRAVDGLFRAGLLARNAAMQSFRAGLVPKKCK